VVVVGDNPGPHDKSFPYLAGGKQVKPLETSATFHDDMVKIQASHLSSTSQEHDHYTTCLMTRLRTNK
jgi:hypothetical protein